LGIFVVSLACAAQLQARPETATAPLEEPRSFPHFSTGRYVLVIPDIEYCSVIVEAPEVTRRFPLSLNPTQPPWEFLLSASKNTLQSYELTRLSHAANLRKEIGTLLDQYLEENSSAMLARWLMEQRAKSVRGADASHVAGESRSSSRPNASDNFLAEPALSPLHQRGSA